MQVRPIHVDNLVICNKGQIGMGFLLLLPLKPIPFTQLSMLHPQAIRLIHSLHRFQATLDIGALLALILEVLYFSLAQTALLPLINAFCPVAGFLHPPSRCHRHRLVQVDVCWT